MMRSLAFMSLAAVGLLPPAALAQSGPTGIAFAMRPEQGSGMCTGGNPTAALDCARKECAETSDAIPEDCARVAWCFPAGWSVVVAVMHKEGIHWSEFSCGWPSREAAIAAGEWLCDLSLRDNIQDCIVGGLWDERGVEISLESE